MEKRSQVSAFVIIAIIVIVALSSFLFVRTVNKEISFNFLSFNKQSSFLREEISNCMRLIYEQELELIGAQGGYYNIPLTPYLDAGFNDIPFYYFGELNYVPDNELLEEELSAAVEFKELECLNLIDEKNIEYEFNFKSTNVSVEENKVVFLTDLLLTLKKGENLIETDFRNYPIEINSALKEMNNFASYIAYDYEINDEGLCISCYTEISDDNGLIVDISSDIDSILIVSIIDNKTDYHPQVYSFALTSLAEFNDSLLLTEDFNLNQDYQEFSEINIEPPPEI